MPTTDELHPSTDFPSIAKLFVDLDASICCVAKGRMPGITSITLRPPPDQPAVHAFYTIVSWLYVCLTEAGLVHFRFLAERARALGVDSIGSLVRFRNDIQNFRTVLQHNLNLSSADDAAKLYSCEKWMAEVLARPLLPEKRFWPEDGDWEKLACALRQQAKHFAEINLKTVELVTKDEFAEDAVAQWILRCIRCLPPHRFDRIAEEVAGDLGLTYLDVLKIRKAHFEKWSNHLRALPETADLVREARRIVEKTLLAESDDYSPVDGRDVLDKLGVKPGPSVAKVLQKGKELFRQRPCNRDDLLKTLSHLIETGEL